MRNKLKMIWPLAGILTSLCFSACAVAEEPLTAPQYPTYVQYPENAPPVVPASQNVQLSPAQLDQLLGPIALYPDPLLSLMFPAATYPQDVQAAQAWLDGTPNPTEDAINAQPWDDSIKGLVHYPTVLKFMSDQMDWTQAVGAAFLNQQQDVMDSIQRLRTEAQAQQNLQNNTQQQIVNDDGAIRIEPVDPDVIYVPQYDPTLVYYSPCPIGWSIGFPIGLWCDNDFDWRRRGIVVGGGWYHGWHHPPAWDQHPPAWDHHPAGWAGTPRPWTRSPQRSAPRVTNRTVSRLGLTGARGAPIARPAPRAGAATNNGARNGVGRGGSRPLPSPFPVGGGTAPRRSNDVFNPGQNRNDIQRADERARISRPGPSRPAVPAVPRPTPNLNVPGPARPNLINEAPRPAPRVSVPREAPAPRPAFSRPEPVRSAPPPQAQPHLSVPNAFNSAPAGQARAESNRGNASMRRR